MKRFFSAFFRSFFTYLFILLVSSPLVMLATFPIVGRPLAASYCDGTVEVDTVTHNIPGRTSVNYEYACATSSGARTPISSTQIMIRVGVYLAVFITVVVWPLIFSLKYKFSGNGRSQGGQIYVNGVDLNTLMAQAQQQQAQSTQSIVINGVALDDLIAQAKEQQNG